MFPFLKRKVEAHDLGAELCHLFVGSDEGQTSFQNFLFWFKLDEIDHKRVYLELRYLRAFAAHFTVFAVQMAMRGNLWIGRMSAMGAILEYEGLYGGAGSAAMRGNPRMDAILEGLLHSSAGFLEPGEMKRRLSIYSEALAALVRNRLDAALAHKPVPEFSVERAVARAFAELSGTEMDFWVDKACLEFSATCLAVKEHLKSVRIV